MATDVRDASGERTAPASRAPSTARKLGLRLGVAAVAVGLFWLLKPNPVEATFKSPVALAKIGAIVVGWLVLSWLLRRLIRNGWVRAVALAVPALVLIALVIAPYFRDKMVNEPLVAVAGPGPTPAAPAASVPESLPAPPAPGQPAAPAPTAPPAPAQPVRLGGGQLTGIGHDATGGAAIFTLPDGQRVVRLDGVDIEPGPDYDVYLVAGANARRPGSGVNLGDLKGNKGSHNYAIPADANLSGEQTVLIWCTAFSVPVGNASFLVT